MSGDMKIKKPLPKMLIATDDETIKATDNVNHPSHYKQGNQETIDIIEDLVKAYPRKIGYHIGNTIKYICRAPFKNNLVEDLKKARWYLDRAIENLDKE